MGMTFKELPKEIVKLAGETTPKLYVYLHDGEIIRVIISNSKYFLGEDRVKSKIFRSLKITRLPKKSKILIVDSKKIIDEYVPTKEVFKKIQSVKPMASVNTKSPSSVSPSSKKNDKRKNEEFQSKQKKIIESLRTDLNHEKKQRKLIDDKCKEQDEKIKELESISIDNRTQRKETEEQVKNEYSINFLRKYIVTLLKTMSKIPTEDLKLFNDRFRLFNSLQVFFLVLINLTLRITSKRDKVDGTLSWYKIRDQGLGHFGDDARVRIYYCLKTHKLRLCYKENEKYEKRFEKNLDK